jgi:hypothetical protein
MTMAKRPVPNPRAVDERGSRHDPGMSAADMERGSQAPSISMRPVQRPTKKFAEGGMVTGSRAQVSGTKFSGTF